MHSAARGLRIFGSVGLPIDVIVKETHAQKNIAVATLLFLSTMPPRPPRDRDSVLHYEPLRASVLDVFEQLGAFDDDSGIVEWIFPEVHEQKELQRTRVKLPEVVEAPAPEPEAPARKSRASRFFRSRSKSGVKKEPHPPTPQVPAPNKLSKKKSNSSPNLRKAAQESASTVPAISSPIKKTATTSPEQKSRRLSMFPRAKSGAQSLDQPRPSISDEEWQQITMTGSIADYETNPFLPHGNNDVGVLFSIHIPNSLIV
jgi:hypothetical protein